jgi:TonB-linked SusC/RagA family outer membrane protein
LKFRSAASIDLSISKNTSWQPSYSLTEMGLDRSENRFNDSRNSANTQVYTNTLTYQNAFGDHSVNVLAGIEYQRIRNSGLSVGGGNFISSQRNFYLVARNQRGEYVIGGGAGNDAFAGYIGRISYDFKQKYLFTATVRRDGTARFAPENRWGTFPSFSAAWRITEESFMSGISFLSDLKIRGSWGQLGNANTGYFPFLFRVSTTPNYGLNGVPLQAPTQTALPNKDVTWETVESFDFGFDVSFLNDKVSLLATYYQRNTKDFLFELPLPYTGGFGNIWGPGSSVNLPVNAGNVKNSGIELELGYDNEYSSGLRIGVSANITTVRNRLTELAPGYQEFASGDYRTAVGHPIGYFYGYKTAGIYQDDQSADGALPDAVAGTNDQNRPRPGDVIFVDTNGPAAEGAPQGVQFSGEPDGNITVQDRAYLGKTIPDFFYGLNLNASFKNFDLSILFQGVSGVQVYNEFRRDNESLWAYGRNRLTSTQERWTGPGTSNSMPRAIEGDPYQNNRFSDRWVEDAGFLRLRNVQLGFTIPKSLLESTRVLMNARIYIGASNLFTITDYSGLDPEVMTYGGNSNQTGAGTDSGNMPQPRIVQAGVQLQF